MTPLRSIVITSLAVLLGASSALALSACSDDDILGDDGDEQVEISVTERDLSPDRVSVDAGKIKFVVKNDGERVHAFAIDTADGVERTDEIKPGEEADITVDLSRGRYRMYDPRGGYRMRGVRGTVIVTADEKAGTVTERTVERTVVEEDDDVDPPPVDEPEIQDPEVQEPPAAPPPAVAPPPVTKTVPAPPPADPTETTP